MNKSTVLSWSGWYRRGLQSFCAPGKNLCRLNPRDRLRCCLTEVKRYHWPGAVGCNSLFSAFGQSHPIKSLRVDPLNQMFVRFMWSKATTIHLYTFTIFLRVAGSYSRSCCPSVRPQWNSFIRSGRSGGDSCSSRAWRRSGRLLRRVCMCVSNTFQRILCDHVHIDDDELRLQEVSSLYRMLGHAWGACR